MKKSLLLLSCLCSLLILKGQNINITISGYVYEQGSLETLPGCLIYDPVSQTSTSTNNYGFYSITLPYQENLFLVFNSFGYENDTLRIAEARTFEYDAHLPKINMLQTIVIQAEKRNTEQVRMSSLSLSTKEIQQLPALLGEKDVFKTLMLMPGVQSASEGTSGIYVRGGGPDQNLVILDEATIYNASHLLGFFSIFNGDAIKSVELIKGGFPARYGGRLSSVIDMVMKDGNKDSYHCEGGVGLISSHLMVEGPLAKNKASFMVSGRATYLTLLAKPIMKHALDGAGVGYYFFDINGKVNYNISKKDRLYLSAYYGQDKFSMESDIRQSSREREKVRLGLFWQNATATARWNHLFSNKAFSNLSFVFSDYQMNTYNRSKITSSANPADNIAFSSNFTSGIRDYTLKYDVSYQFNPTHRLLAGATVIYHVARPNAMVVKSDTSSMKRVEKENALEYALYVEDEINFRNKFRINPGIRMTCFSVPHKTYFSPEPRLSMSYNFLPNLALKASYAMMSQSMTLLNTSTIGLPTDLWVPITDKVKPQRSQQVALGVHYDLRNPRLSFSIEGYYKSMNNILAYKEGASFFMDMIETMMENQPANTTNFQNRWSQNVTSGKGWSYGVEFLVRKEIGKVTGWVGYTLSWTKQQFDELNFGKPYFARYDRRHDVSIVVMYSPTPKINLSASWVFASGNAVTLPSSIYMYYTLTDHLNLSENVNNDITNTVFQGFTENYGDKNNVRMKPFHHLDIGVQFLKPHKKNKGQSIFEVSIYNVYNYKNPFFYFVGSEYDEQAQNSVPVIKQICIFPIIPTFTYSFKF